MSDFSSGCCDTPGAGCTREDMLKARLRSSLRLLGCQFPSLFYGIDIWRPTVVTPVLDSCGNEDFPDAEKEVWVRMGENIPAFVYEKEERFYQAGEGVVFMTITNVIIPEGMGIQGDDHVILHGFAFAVTRAKEQAGVCFLQVEKAKSRFIRPARSEPTYRQFGAKARIE